MGYCWKCDWNCFLKLLPEPSRVLRGGFCLVLVLFLINLFLYFIFFQGWKWSRTGLLPVCVPGAVSWLARDIQVSKPPLRTVVAFDIVVVFVGVFFILLKHLKGLEKSSLESCSVARDWWSQCWKDWWDSCWLLSLKIFSGCYSVACSRKEANWLNTWWECVSPSMQL